MRRPALIAVAALAALAAAGCGTSACQQLGEQLCQCQAGMTKDTCKTQVQNQLNDLGVDTPGFPAMVGKLSEGKPLTFEEYCQQRLDACVAPADVNFCEWILTAPAKDACGLTPANPVP
jgi:hypothetical protein